VNWQELRDLEIKLEARQGEIMDPVRAAVMDSLLRNISAAKSSYNAMASIQMQMAPHQATLDRALKDVSAMAAWLNVTPE
jgi:hypothetical protein